MKELRFDQFDWDHGNSTKSLSKHHIGTNAIEGFFGTEPAFIEDPQALPV